MRVAAALSILLGVAGCSAAPQAHAVLPYTSLSLLQSARDGAFTERVRYNFPLDAKKQSPIFPSEALFLGAGGGLYGPTATYAGQANAYGTVFEWGRIRGAAVLHRFHGRYGGAYPSQLVGDENGTLYGTTLAGGVIKCLGGLGCGIAFKLTPSGSEYANSVIHRFRGGDDGILPSALTLSADGVLYGETAYGGGNGCGQFGCGTVFALRPFEDRYRETIIYRFVGGRDGRTPMGGVAIDRHGNFFGVTLAGGKRCSEAVTGCGTVYELMRHGDTYEHRVLYRFRGIAAADGAFPNSIMRGPDGALYGTARGGKSACRYGCGTVFELSPAESGYTERILTRFDPAHGNVDRGLSTLLLEDGVLYGTTAVGGDCVNHYFTHGCGTVYRIDPQRANLRIIYEFQGPPHDGAAPTGGLIPVGSAFYGATASGGSGECSYFTGCGTIYALSRSSMEPSTGF